MKFKETHLDCPCGKHKDCYAVNEDGSGKCFSCGKFTWPKPFWEHLSECEVRPYASRGVPSWVGERLNFVEFVDKGGFVQFFGYNYPDGVFKARRKEDKRDQQMKTPEGKRKPALGGIGLYDPGTSRNCVVVEGEPDAAAAYYMLNDKMANETPVYWLLGSSISLKDKPSIVEELSKYERVIMAIENDDAGNKAKETLGQLLPKSIRVSNLVKHKDANDYLLAGDTKEFKRCIANYSRYTPEFIYNGIDKLTAIWNEAETEFYVPTPFSSLNELVKGIPLGHIFLITGPEGIGKQLPTSTPIPTPYGFTPMGSLRVGDTVFGADGKPCTVTYVTETQYNVPCYKVVFADGTEQVAGGPHKWGVYNSSSGKYSVKTTEEIYQEGPLRGEVSRYSVPISGPVEFGLPSPSVDPYLLGYWLGDGHSYSANITVGKEDLAEFTRVIGERGVEVTNCVADRNGNFSVRVHALTHKDLTNLGVLKNKHIPDSFMYAPIPDRWALLQGLLDSDGSVAGSGIEFYSSNKTLFDQFTILARSLGLKVRVRKKTAWFNGKEYGDTFTAWFLVNKEKPFLFQRKMKKVTPCKTYRKSRKTIRDIIPVESVPSRCIQVDSSDHLYLCGDHFTVTHNTEILRALAWSALSKADGPVCPVSMTLFEEDNKTMLKAFGCYDQGINFRDPDKKFMLSEIQPTLDKLAEDFYVTDFYKARDDMSVQSFMEKISYLHFVCGVKYFFIDPINQLRPDAPEEPLVKFLDGISMEMARFCVDNQVGCVWTAHTTDEGKTRDSRMIAKAASIRVDVHRDLENFDESERNKTYLTVSKNRPFSRVGPAGYVVFDPSTFTIQSDDTERTVRLPAFSEADRRGESSKEEEPVPVPVRSVPHTYVVQRPRDF